MRELDIASFAADLGAKEDASAVLLGEPGGGAVALEQGQLFMELGDLDVDSGAQRSFDRFDIGAGPTNEEKFISAFAEHLHQPEQPRIGGNILGRAMARRLIRSAGGTQRYQMNLARREPGHGPARITKHHPADAVPVEQISDKLPSMRFGPGRWLGQLGSELRIVAAKSRA